MAAMIGHFHLGIHPILGTQQRSSILYPSITHIIESHRVYDSDESDKIDSFDSFDRSDRSDEEKENCSKEDNRPLPCADEVFRSQSISH